MVINNPHFIRSIDIPEFAASKKFQEVYKELHSRNSSAFILREGTGATFVKANVLAEKVVTKARTGSSDLDLDKLSEATIGEILQDSSYNEAKIPVRTTRLAAYAPPPHEIDTPGSEATGETVSIVETGGEEIGWYLNRETLREITAKRTVFLCNNPDGAHENPDFDSGECYQCPFEITGTAER